MFCPYLLKQNSAEAFIKNFTYVKIEIMLCGIYCEIF